MQATGSTAHAWKAKYPVLPPAFEPKPMQTQQRLFSGMDEAGRSFMRDFDQP